MKTQITNQHTDSRKALFLSIGMLVLLAATLPLMAQAPDGSHTLAYPPVHVSNVPQHPNSPPGILPVQFKAADGSNQVPNQDQGSNPLGILFSGGLVLFGLAILVSFVLGCWKVFTKAGQPGWAILIPIYNGYILLKIAGRPGWWLLLYLIPVVNIVIAIIVAIDIAKVFGQNALFGFFLLFLLCGIGYPMLGFGNCRYQGVAAVATA